MDALSPTFSHASLADLGSRLENICVQLHASPETLDGAEQQQGFLLLVNLAARLYPRIALSGPDGLLSEASLEISRINPECEVVEGRKEAQLGVSWGAQSMHRTDVAIGAAGWAVRVGTAVDGQPARSNPLVAMAAAAVGASELFRRAFEPLLDLGRPSGDGYELQLLTTPELRLPEEIVFESVYLAGAGAVGQATLAVLSAMPCSGELVVVDPETVTLSNLQRYVLAGDNDVGASKVLLAARALEGSSLRCRTVEAKWGGDVPGFAQARTVCTALDSAADRIAVQSGLPRVIYNAWTQPSDLGCSTHEHFGIDPCLACLYWPQGRRKSQHELVARALKQPELRILAYLTHNVPIDRPLLPAQIPKIPSLPAPPDSQGWCERSLLSDVARVYSMDGPVQTAWSGRLIGELYRDGICGGGIVGSRSAELPAEVAVPMAHQSMMAGTLLALSLLCGVSPELKASRVVYPERRMNFNVGQPNLASVPRAKTPGCLCSDRDFLGRYADKWQV